MTSQESPIASATTRHGLLAYGVRRIRSDTMSLFKKDFEAWIISHSAHLNAAFAFPEPSDVDLLHLLFWTKTSDAGVLEELSSNAFAELDDDSDGVFLRCQFVGRCASASFEFVTADIPSYLLGGIPAPV